jgi:hypothetical protein
MTKTLAVVILMKDVRDIRRSTIARIIARRRFIECHKEIPIEFLLLSARQEFIAERSLMQMAKRRLEHELGEELGPIADQDGRLI